MTDYTWSYSALSTFQQCPRKYYRIKVAKDIKELDRAGEILDVLLALLKVERVKATLLLCETQHLY